MKYHHNRLYQKLLNSKEWKRLRMQKLAANPLCEIHYKQGKIVAASCVHHIVPVESGHSESECRTLAYSWSNLQSLCRECHAEIHNKAGYHTKEAHQQREQERLQQWIAKLKE